jgi:hypothetical protein
LGRSSQHVSQENLLRTAASVCVLSVCMIDCGSTPCVVLIGLLCYCVVWQI